MSRSNPTTSIKNPAQMWIEWDGSKGAFRYFDKEKGEKGENVYLDDLTFLYLDKVGCVTGYSDAYGSSIYSNQVRSTKQQPLEVSTFNKKDGPIAKGLWANIKDAVDAKGGKFTANIYAATKNENNELRIVCIQLKASALSAWSDFEKAAGDEINKKAVTLSGKETGKKGAISFVKPKFSLVDVSEETNNKAVELDKQLQTYLAHAINFNAAQETEDAAPDVETAEKMSKPVSIEEKKKLLISDPAFAAILQNISKGETTVSAVTAKYDVDQTALQVLQTTEDNAIGSDIDGLDDDNPDDLPF